MAHCGRMLPASAPVSVPRLQAGSATHIAPKKYHALSAPGCAMARPNSSSVTSKPTSSRSRSGVSGWRRWLSAQLISRYRAFTISVISTITQIPASSEITVMPPYSPAEALLSRLIRKLWKAVRLAAWQEMPTLKLTAK